MGTEQTKGVPTGAGIRIALVENDVLARKPLEYLLARAMPDLCIVETSTNGRDATQYCLQHRRSIDMLLTDMHLGDVDGPAIAWRLRRAGSMLPILGVTSLPLDHYHNAAVAAGMQGLLPKSNIARIVAALRDLQQGKPCAGYESPAMAVARISKSHSVMHVLTDTQAKVLELAADGYDSNGIAQQLHCAPSTVRKHKQNILTRLNVPTIQEAVAQWTRFQHMFNLD
ncbi:LuxR C-terminal-related transcriptional regulator [Bifidobacterium pseudolongum]|uniref:LuxR C-terminal-related transcriptional regulator n=1 Tax=Bifidobacterium pseudolongum TaxID=1694 RepID=UPI00101F57E8|nr:response regulator transcription factor [Bifidobacterium pseudolongum]MCH4855823.1 response regulator transcription factor [Bifidobacterium pseudolongum]MCH4859439.1 response regulator transcription factor [Bifidobacterium pseudolongum]MCH4861210.1 response regulator transcription factor [Bifidobacterium pseudolongum]